ncbi:MAG: ParB N-terminal domain-containing protein [Candidatus Neomarinimicrobiota bacterium]
MKNRINNNNLVIGELPLLCVVNIDEILFHEEPDLYRVDGLINELTESALLKHPPVVTNSNNVDKKILIDGANRVTALQKMGLKRIIVQVVNIPEPRLKLDCWHHVLEDISPRALLDFAYSIDGIKLIKSSSHTSEGYLFSIRFSENTLYNAFGHADLMHQMEQLKKFVESFKNHPYRDRVSYTNLEYLKKNYQRFSALITYRHLTIDQVISMAMKGVTLPSGITRFLLPKRALHCNIKLNVLQQEKSLKELNQEFDKFIMNKIRNKRIRFYHEPTFHFDD